MKTVLERSEVLSNELLNYVKCSPFFSHKNIPRRWNFSKKKIS